MKAKKLSYHPEPMVTVWNASQLDATFFVDSDQLTIGAGHHATYPKALGDKVLALAKVNGWPLQGTIPDVVNVDGVACTPLRAVPAIPAPVVVDTGKDVVRALGGELAVVPRAALIRVAGALGLPPLYTDETTKKTLVADILQFAGQATVPPTGETGATNTAASASKDA